MLVIDANLARKLIEEQFPKWAQLPIRPVEKDGFDNRTFHLGDSMAIRLPSAEVYVAQVEKENKWLPYPGANLNISISFPLAKGKPSNLYPWS